MTTYTATYSPDDNKLRLYTSSRLDAETYAKVKAAGFKWAPKQELWVAPMWTPYREDLLMELAGEIGDEDTRLVDRANERAERFDTYSDNRANDAERARKTVDSIVEHIPMGQPILVGHHSERHARKDAARIESGMRKAVKMWETSKYWESRAAGAIQHAKYKELPGARHRRIKGLESDRRKRETHKQECDMWLKLWIECEKEPDLELQKEVALRIANMCSLDMPRKEGDNPTLTFRPSAYTILSNAHPTLYAPRSLSEIIERAKLVYPNGIAYAERWIAHLDNRLLYERAMLAEQVGVAAGTDNAMSSRFDLKVGGEVLIGRDGWLIILRVNKKGGVILSVTTQAPRAVTWSRSWKYGIEKVQDYREPTAEQTERVKKATALPPICNYPGEGFREMTDAEWSARRKWSDFPYIKTVAANDEHGAYRYRQMPHPKESWQGQRVFITDAKRVDRPAPRLTSEPLPPAPAAAPMIGHAKPQPRTDDPKDAAFAALKTALKTGVKVVAAPQLFPTPTLLGEQMIELAEIKPGHLVLDPSAGTGVLLALARAAGAVTTAVEIDSRLVARLRLDFDDVRQGDFLMRYGDLGTFDRVLMNPPFERGADILHIKHATTMLRPGGRLIAICANGPRQRAALQPLASKWIDLPDGSFAAQGTNVRTAMLMIEA